MKTVEVHTWCDLHPADQQVPGQQHVVEIDGLRRLLDLCGAHESDLGLGGLRKVLEASGRRPEAVEGARHRGGRRARTAPAAGPTEGQGQRQRTGKPTDAPRPYVCPWCSLDYTQSTGLMRHVGIVHGLQAPGGRVGALLGGRCPLCGAAGLVMVDAHCGKQHQVPWSVAVRQARTDGDRHGVVAPLDAQAQQVQGV